MNQITVIPLSTGGWELLSLAAAEALECAPRPGAGGRRRIQPGTVSEELNLEPFWGPVF